MLCAGRATFAALTLLTAVSQAHAQVAELHYDLRVDIPVLVVASGWVIGAEFARPVLAAKECRWCELNPIDDAVRDALRWSKTTPANASSSVTAYALTPLAAIGLLAWAEAHDDSLSNFWVDIMSIAQAVTISTGVTQVFKFATARERPNVHILSEDEKSQTSQTSNNNTSFFSGHTNFAFSLAVAAGTVATMRNYRWAPWIWISGLVFATATAYFRVAGDSHYLTDVLAGAWTGAAFGIVVPYLLHRPLAEHGVSLNVSGTPGGFFVSAAWR
jgi:membrane-associated phospholipid phosphatase